MNQNDIANMADFIAQQIHHAAAPDEQWADVEEGERDQFRLIAHAAMGAHDAWLTTAGFRIVKLEKKKPKPKLVGFDKPALIGFKQ